MVNMRCQHLQSRINHNLNQHILNQWRSLLFHHNCQARLATSLASRSTKDPFEQQQLLELQQMKSSGRKRIPVHINSKINQSELSSPSLLTVQGHLQQGESEAAWKVFDKLACQHHIPPHSTTSLLLDSLRQMVEVDAARLNLNFGRLSELYYSRLEILAGLVRRNKELKWNNEQFQHALELYGKLNQVKRAESIFKNATAYTNTPPTVEHYNQLLRIYLAQLKPLDNLTKQRWISKMTTLQQDMTKKGLVPTTTTFNILLAAKVKAHDLEGAEKLYATMIALPDGTTYNILLNGYLKTCRSNKDKEMIKIWLDRLIQVRTKPNKRTFNNIMDGLATQALYLSRTKNYQEMNSTVQAVSHIYQTMIQNGFEPDTNIINTLLKCYANANNSAGVEDVVSSLIFPKKEGGCSNCGNCGCGGKKPAAETVASETPVPVVEEKPKIKVKPDIYTFNMLMKYYLDNNQSDQAFQMYDVMVTAKLEPDTVTYNNFIWYYASQGNVKELLRYVDVMQKKGIPYNNHIYNTLLNCSLKYPNESQLLAPHLRKVLASVEGNLDSVSYNIQLARHQIEEQGDINTSFERFTDLLEQNLYANPILDTRSYNTILQSSGKFYKSNSKHRSRYQSSNTLDHIIASLDTSNLKPDIYTFALQIRNAAYLGKMNKAEDIYRTMIDTGIKPNNFVLSHMIYGYVKTGRVEKAEDLLRFVMNEYRLTPNAINYAPLIQGFVESADYDKAYRLFREMLDANVTADIGIYTILASVFLKSPAKENEERAIELLEGIEKSGMKMDSASLTLLTEAYSRHMVTLMEGNSKDNVNDRIVQYTDKIHNVYQTLKNNQWLDAKAITTLLAAYGRLDQPDATWKLWNEFKNDSSVTLSTCHYNAVIQSLTSNKAWYPVAKMTFDEMNQNPTVYPDNWTFNLMIWGAHNAADDKTVCHLWHSFNQANPGSIEATTLLTRNYYAVLTAMLNTNNLDEAKIVYQQFSQLSPLPSSTIFWKNMIKKLALHHDL